MKQTLEFRLGQHLVMTPQMRQAIRLLQLSSIELRAELREIAESNFMLELEDEQPRDEWGAGPAPEHGGRATEDLPEPEESLRDRLFWQLDNARLSKREHLDGSMDDLIETLEDLGLGVEPEEVEAVLQRVQRFEPTGVGARTLAECLRRQLEELATDTPYRELALVVARSHLEAVAWYDLARLRRELGTSREELDGALALLRQLNPRPGAGYAGAPTEYITPDLRVFREGRKWKVELNPGTIPRVRINPLYAGFVRRGDRGGENQSLKQHLAEARSLLKSLGNRAETMLRVAKRNRSAPVRVSRARGRGNAAAGASPYRVRARSARIDRVPGHQPQVRPDPPRRVRAQALLFQPDLDPGRRSGVCRGNPGAPSEDHRG